MSSRHTVQPELQTLFTEWRAFERPPLHEGAPDYSPAQRAALDGDFVAMAKARYDQLGDGRTNLAYGYVNRGA